MNLSLDSEVKIKDKPGWYETNKRIVGTLNNKKFKVKHIYKSDMKIFDKNHQRNPFCYKINGKKKVFHKFLITTRWSV